MENCIIVGFFVSGILNIFGVTNLTNEKVFLCSLGCLVFSIGGCFNKMKNIFNGIGGILIIVSIFLTERAETQIVNKIKELTGITENAVLLFSMSFTLLSIKVSKQLEKEKFYKQNELNKRILKIFNKIEKI